MRFLLPTLAVAAAGVLTLHSQIPAPAPEEPAELQQIKSANALLIERQKQTLEKLDEMLEAARQLKIYTKRG